MSNKIQIKWYTKGNHLAEEYQSVALLFSFISSQKNGNTICHEWIKCRDFLHDAVRNQLTGKNDSIYGFKFDEKNPKLDTERMRLAVTQKGFKDETSIKEFKSKMRHAIKLLNHFESVAKIPSPSKVTFVETDHAHYKMVAIFNGHSIWMKAPFLVSLYSYLIRLQDKKIKFKDKEDLKDKFKELVRTDSTDKDIRYLKTIHKHVHSVMENLKEVLNPAEEKNGFDKYYFDETISISSFHNNSGIVSLIAGTIPKKEINSKVKEILNMEKDK